MSTNRPSASYVSNSLSFSNVSDANDSKPSYSKNGGHNSDDNVYDNHSAPTYHKISYAQHRRHANGTTQHSQAEANTIKRSNTPSWALNATSSSASGASNHSLSNSSTTEAAHRRRRSAAAAAYAYSSGIQDDNRNSVLVALQQKLFENYRLVAYTIVILTYLIAFCVYVYLRLISIAFPDRIAYYKRCKQHANETVVRNELHFVSAAIIFIFIGLFQLTCLFLLTVSEKWLDVRLRVTRVVSIKERLRYELAFLIRRVMFATVFPTFFVYCMCSAVVICTIFYVIGIRDAVGIGSEVLIYFFDSCVLVYLLAFPIVGIVFYPGSRWCDNALKRKLQMSPTAGRLHPHFTKPAGNKEGNSPQIRHRKPTSSEEDGKRKNSLVQSQTSESEQSVERRMPTNEDEAGKELRHQRGLEDASQVVQAGCQENSSKLTSKTTRKDRMSSKETPQIERRVISKAPLASPQSLEGAHHSNDGSRSREVANLQVDRKKFNRLRTKESNTRAAARQFFRSSAKSEDKTARPSGSSFASGVPSSASTGVQALQQRLRVDRYRRLSDLEHSEEESYNAAGHSARFTEKPQILTIKN